jgi:dolichyl-phosphate beta-glucosyltransferase
MNKKLPKQLSVVIPLFNEAERFNKGFKICQKFTQKFPSWELIFVNDGSTDNTKEIVTNLIKPFSQMSQISYSNNKGKGFAIKKGIENAKKPHILFTDIDFSTSMDQLKLFYPFIENGADIVIGTRKVKGAKIIKHQKAYREFLGRQFTHLCNLILGLNFSDYTCGFKLFRSSVAKKLFKQLTIFSWGFDAEILFLAVKSKCKIVEIPVSWENDDNTKVKLIKDMVNSFLDLFKIRLNQLNNKYKLK